MDLMPLLVDALLAPHTTVRTRDACASPAYVEESPAGWLVTAALPGVSSSEVVVETSRDAQGDAHLWLRAPKSAFDVELRCVSVAV